MRGFCVILIGITWFPPLSALKQNSIVYLVLKYRYHPSYTIGLKKKEYDAPDVVDVIETQKNNTSESMQTREKKSKEKKDLRLSLRNKKKMKDKMKTQYIEPTKNRRARLLYDIFIMYYIWGDRESYKKKSTWGSSRINRHKL